MKKNYTGKLEKINQFLKKLRIPFRVTFILMGIASTVWFLVRVIPKPSRAAYPCMQAAAPVMSGFIVYLITILSSAIAFRWVKRNLKKYRFGPAALALLLAFSASVVFLGNNPYKASANVKVENAIHVSNDPMGQGQGIFPGRVVWVWDPDATNENTTNTWMDVNNPNDDDGYFMPQNNDQDVIDSLFAASVKQLTGEESVTDAWIALFKYHNNRKGLGELDYSDGETIFIKINQGTAGWMSNPDNLAYETAPSWREGYYGVTETLDHLILSVLRELVTDYGIPQENIYVGDPIAHVFKHTYDYLVAEFPDVKYFDKSYSTLGRTLSAGLTSSEVIHYSDSGKVMKSAGGDKIYLEMENADYLINMACLKGHERAGITLTAKNHFGSHSRESAAHLHPGLVWVDKADWGGTYDLMRTDYGMYRVQVDIMGSKFLGGNTMLYMVDGLWAGPEATWKPCKWKSAPFNNDYPSSIFVSLDQVALESVCFDFLRTEFTEQNHPDSAFPNYPAADDYLHQAADPATWPEGIEYMPDGVNVLSSLGTHEHWNNDSMKQYSRNLGLDYGIELYAPGIVTNLPGQVTEPGNPPVPVAEPGKHILHRGSKPVIIFNSLNLLFSDPDGDALIYTVSPVNQAHIDAWVQDDTVLIASAGIDFTGTDTIILHISDSKDTIDYPMSLQVADENIMSDTVKSQSIVFDGIGDDHIWKDLPWYYIDQVWMPYRASITANDFSGRYKIAWSKTDNVLYFLAETTDDVFVDGYYYNSNPSSGGGYPNYDILEIFIDEDKSGGEHVFDNTGENAENAFSYHMAISEPIDGGTVTDLVVCDIAGTSWGYPDQWIPNYAGHFQDFIVRRSGNTLTWEFSLKVYDDSYDDSSSENSRILLNEEKQIGLSLAYCDNDDLFEDPPERDNFYGTDVGPDTNPDNWNEHWMNADVYGTLILVTDQQNHAPVLAGSIDDLVIHENNIAYTAAEDLIEIFLDPDNDQLAYSIETENPNLSVDILGGISAVVTALDGFSGMAEVTVHASDGVFTQTTQFTVSSTVSVAEYLRLKQSVQIVPNPVGSKLRVNIDNELYGLIDIAIFELSGKMINKYQVTKTGQLLHFVTDVSSVPPGTYIIKVQQGGILITKKFLH